MKKFQFRLQPLLRYREYLERLAKIEVSNVLIDIAESEKRIDHAKDSRSVTATRLDEESSRGISSERFRLFTNYIEGIEAFLETENEHRRQLLELLVEKQKKLTQKSVEKKVLENLKKKRKEQYYGELRKSIQKEADDTIIVRKARDINL